MTDASPPFDVQRLLAEEPFVRALARALVGGDAEDVVQQTWLRALQGGGEPVRSPRSWLARIVHNVAANDRRGARRRRERERATAAEPLVPSSAELMEREESRRALVRAVDALEAPLRTVVLLRWFDGLPPRAIARRLGVPVTTVGNRLRRAHALLRERLDAQHGGERRAWLVPLASFALPRAARPALPALLSATILMTMKAKTLFAGGVLAAAVVALVWTLSRTPPQRGAPDVAAAPPPALQQGEVRGDAAAAAPGTAPVRAPVATEPQGAAATTGSLTVRLVFASDRAPGAEIGVTVTDLAQYGSPVGAREARTDESGVATVADLVPGRHLVTTDRRTTPAHLATIEAGATRELTIELPAGVDVRGIVVDRDGVAIGGAVIDFADLGMLGDRIAPIARTGADGRFALRAVAPSGRLRARAPGYAVSPLILLHGSEGGTLELRIALADAGGTVAGRVTDPAGEPVAGALVRIGEDESSHGILTLPDGAAAQRSTFVEVATDAEGAFRAVGVATGDHLVIVRAADLAPWTGRCAVAAYAETPLEVRLAPGARCSGTVRDGAGAPVRGAEVEVGRWDSLLAFRARSAADGTYRLDGLPPGEVGIAAEHEKHGKAAATLQVAAGECAIWDATLSRGVELRGRVLSESGSALAKLEVMGEARLGPRREDWWYTRALTGADGRFALANCPDGTNIAITVMQDGFRLARRENIDPRAGELLVHVRALAAPSAHIVGTIVDADGRPVSNATVTAPTRGTMNTRLYTTEAGTGRFAIGPIRPAEYVVTVEAREHAELRTAPRMLRAGETWDLGTLRLERGGRVCVALGGVATPADLMLTVFDDELRLRARIDERDSARLPSGRYRLAVAGSGIAARLVPFEIRDGSDTQVAVDLAAGEPCELRLELPPGADRVVGTVTIRGHDDVVLQRAVWLGVEAQVVTAALAPGEYTAVVRSEAGHEGRATFTAGGPPVTIALR
jgi:RNA polymerase sigma factor (sigma-70 family)